MDTDLSDRLVGTVNQYFHLAAHISISEFENAKWFVC